MVMRNLQIALENGVKSSEDREATKLKNPHFLPRMDGWMGLRENPGPSFSLLGTVVRS